MNSLLWLPVILPIFAAAAGYFFRKRVFASLLYIIQTGQVVLVTMLLVRVRNLGPVEHIFGPLPAGVGIGLSADIVSSLMTAVVGWLFFLLIVYNRRKLYMDRIFLFLFMTLQGLMIGLFLSRDLFNIYVLLELSTLVVSILIMFKHDKQTLYDGMIYLMMNLASMSFMLLGIGFVYRTFGTLDFQQLSQALASVAQPRALILPFSLIVTGIAMKAALFLLFTWLPSAHGAPSAPSMVSAALSGVQVKAGVYLLIRWMTLFSGALPVGDYFVVFGFATAIIGVFLALNQRTLKLVLAYSTISQVGLIIIGASLGSETQFYGSILHIVNHAIVKALLFLSAGMVIHIYGTKEIARIRGVLRRYPLLGLSMLMGILGIIGTPVFNGSISKYLIQGSLSLSPFYLAMALVNVGTTVTFFRFGRILFGAPEQPEKSSESRTVRQPDLFTTTVIMILGIASFVFGILAEPIISFLLNSDISVSGAFTIEKLIIYLATLAVAAIITRIISPLDGFRVKLIKSRPSFSTVMIGVTVFFTSLGAYLMVAS